MGSIIRKVPIIRKAPIIRKVPIARMVKKAVIHAATVLLPNS